jgi:hypothetical protein
MASVEGAMNPDVIKREVINMATKATMIATTTAETTGMQDMLALVGEKIRGDSRETKMAANQLVAYKQMTVNSNGDRRTVEGETMGS